jgi:hypothetical protein
MTNILPRTTVSLQIPVKRQLLLDLLCTAIEGGSNYWASFTNLKRTVDGDYEAADVWDTSDAEAVFLGRVHAEDLILGLERLATAQFATAMTHLADALGEEGDAITADVVLQMTVVENVIYG